MTRNLDFKTLKIDQLAFIQDLFIEENVIDYNSASITIKARSVIKMNKANNYTQTNFKAYHWLIGKLGYLLCGTRPRIALIIGKLSKRNTDPRIGHLKATKRVIWYLKVIMQLGIVYEVSDVNSILYRLIGYANSNYAGDPEDKKSIIGHCFFINGVVISWYSKKEWMVSTSTTKAEYIVLAHAIRESI